MQIRAALMDSSGGKPPSRATSVLLDTLNVGDPVCPIEVRHAISCATRVQERFTAVRKLRE